jgi:hypothetical protein
MKVTRVITYEGTEDQVRRQIKGSLADGEHYLNGFIIVSTIDVDSASYEPVDGDVVFPVPILRRRFYHVLKRRISLWNP